MSRAAAGSPLAPEQQIVRALRLLEADPWWEPTGQATSEVADVLALAMAGYGVGEAKGMEGFPAFEAKLAGPYDDGSVRGPVPSYLVRGGRRLVLYFMQDFQLRALGLTDIGLSAQAMIDLRGWIGEVDKIRLCSSSVRGVHT